jgi:hypothetical protein
VLQVGSAETTRPYDLAMRLTRALSLLALLLLSSCATNPLSIPPPPHALPSRPRGHRITEEGIVAESRPAAVPSGFDVAAAPDDSWRAGDSVTFELEFEDGSIQESFWFITEVTSPANKEEPLSRATVKTTLLDHDGAVIGTSQRKVTPSRLSDRSREVHDAYAAIVTAATNGETPAHLQELIDDELGEGTPFDDSRKAMFREMKRTVAPRFLRKRLEKPAINSSIGSISILDLALAALTPIEVLIDVQRLNEEQSIVEDFADVPVEKPMRLPFVMSIGGAIQFRFAVTLTTAVPPYVLTGGILEIAGVNEARGDRRFLLRIVGAKRGTAPESRPAESQPSEDDAAHDR